MDVLFALLCFALDLHRNLFVCQLCFPSLISPHSLIWSLKTLLRKLPSPMKRLIIVVVSASGTMEAPFRGCCAKIQEWRVDNCHKTFGIGWPPVKRIFRSRSTGARPQVCCDCRDWYCSSFPDVISETHCSIALTVPWTAIPTCGAAPGST
jgi:hypothetical protein